MFFQCAFEKLVISNLRIHSEFGVRNFQSKELALAHLRHEITDAIKNK